MKKLNLSMIATKYKDQIINIDLESKPAAKIWLAVGLALGLTAFLVQFHKTPSKLERPVETRELDSYIPEGQSLVPIQVANYESLDQIIGNYGVVDLYSTPLNPTEKAKRIAFAAKLIRSPKSPGHFSVLVPANEAYRIVGYHGQFTVSVRNPKLLGTHFVKNKAKTTKRRILFESE